MRQSHSIIAMGRIRSRLTYANVVATLALAVAVGTGGAYAVDKIGSGNIRNNSVRSIDLRNGQGVRGADVVPDSLRGNQIRESSLISSDFVPVAGSQVGTCDPEQSSHTECVTTEVTLERRGRLLVVATGDFAANHNEPQEASADCRITIDGQSTPVGSSPGEVLPNTSPVGTDGFAQTFVSPALARGMHEVALACEQLGSNDILIQSPTIAVLGVTVR